MTLAVALVAAATERTDGDEAARRFEFSAALAAYERCAAEGSAADVRYCAAHVAQLAPQTADNFVGWTVLARARREGAHTNVREHVQAALTANPTGPAADSLRRWLSVDAALAGDIARAEETAPAGATAWLREREVEARRNRHRRWIGLAGVLTASIYLLTTLHSAAKRRGSWRFRAAGAAAALLGGVPIAFAAAWDPSLMAGFVGMASVVTASVLGAGRAPVWVAAPGTLGGVAAMAWWNGWFPSLGIG